MEQFDEYFQIADLDHDGIINGAEARAFFHGANLPQHVLSQIWTYVNQNKTEYLTRLEFYNALKLVTVAQSKRELTREIVSAALYGPASTIIPPPQINLAQPNMVLPGQSTNVSPQLYGIVNTQFEPAHSTTVSPSTAGMNQMFRQVQPLSTGMSQQVNSSVSSLGTSAQEQSHTSWPKMTSASVQSYVKVFMQMGKDKDGKITGMEARNLFLSWRLPMELLKQVWDLSDQDKDGVLSLREFCIALYFTEQYRGERQLPPVLPNSVMLDETLWSLVGPPAAHGNVGCAPTTGIMSVDPSSLSSHAYHIRNKMKISADTKGQESSKINEKIGNNEKLLMDYREKIEFYQAKMQDLVLHNSRCDNLLNGITERSKADKAEAESLKTKCEEKEKLISEMYSKLMIQAASFGEVQERIHELHQAILKMEHGGNADGILQVRAGRIQSDIEELLKALPDRCRKHDVQIRSAAAIEPPTGWQHGIPEIAAIWDGNWDKFDDEEFSCDMALSANSNGRRENSPDTVLNTYAMSEKRFSTDASAFDAESKYSADEPKSPRVINESETRKYNDNHVTKNSDGDDVTQRNFDEPALDSFDNDSDNDSVWGFNTKDSDNGTNEEKYFFGSKDFVASPERTASLSAQNSFHRPFTFKESDTCSPHSWNNIE